MTNPYTLQRFFFLTLDPVHVGTGGYRLGRVDLSIVREPGTHLPKIPGTSLHGAARSYAAMRYGKPQCAGQQGHCGQSSCPVCYTFGTVRVRPGNTGNSQQLQGGNAGAVSLSDARLLLFPVHSMAGPVWVTSPMTLRDVGVDGQTVSEHKARWPSSLSTNNKLNFGWLMLEREQAWQLPNGALNDIPGDIRQRTVLVSDKLFSHIVNSNLEVRTSVSINPATGAAEEGALFTYEALPRATVLWCDVVEDDYQREPVNKASKFPITEKKCLAKEKRAQNSDDKKEVEYVDNAGASLGEIWRRPLDVVRAGFALIEYLGVGGMGTRGFGRIKRIADWEVKHDH